LFLGEPCTVNEVEAPIVRRIFQEFAQGRSPRAIAQSLNKEDVPGPAGRSWGPSTIYGNWQRGTGILNNELYIGRLVWNRQQFIKDPNTERRQARLNPESKWVIEEVPHLRIIEDSLWISVKKRQRESRSQVMTKDKASVPSVHADPVTSSQAFSSVEAAVGDSPRSVNPTTVAPPPETKELATIC